MINHRRPATVTVSRSGPADLCGELGLEVGGEDYERVVIVGAADVDFLPAGHDVGVVGGDDDEVVDAFVLWDGGLVGVVGGGRGGEAY